MLDREETVNPYEPAPGDVRLIRSAVCYADILGWSIRTKEAFAQGKGGEFLLEARAAIQRAYQHLRRCARPIMHSQHTRPRNFEVKTFTDHIVIGLPLDPVDELAEGLERLCEHVAHLQGPLASNGFLLRGGIAVGWHYMDDDFAYGDALLEAVTGDAEDAPPRIVLTESAQRVVTATRAEKQNRGYPWGRTLVKSADEVPFVDYLSPAINLGDRIFHEIFEGHRSTIENGLQRSPSVKVSAKLQWAGEFQNWVIQETLAGAERRRPSDEEEQASWRDVMKLRQSLIDTALLGGNLLLSRDI